ncbi:MAG: penicillin-binding protein [Candidatus Pacebacteria bacterium]|nr:penicillin-binding protein [Candidatus Paceibacterota bacterium]
MTHRSHTAKKYKKHIRHIKTAVVISLSAVFILVGIGALWMASLRMPDLNSFETRKVVESTKIYDRTGTILLYDTGANAKRTVITLDQIAPNIQKATIAIEDSNFYNNIGIEPTSIIRAVLANLATGSYSQGASTITQQVVKNALLSQEKTISRKLEEWILSVKLTRLISKDKILEAYLNETPYGGTIYGVEEATQTFFGKQAKDITLAESAYIAAIPQAPTYFSPYGTHRKQLDARQKLVLSRMKELGMITDIEYSSAIKEQVTFLNKNAQSIRAPHFVMSVLGYLTEKYGEDAVVEGGLKVITTLDFDMQQKAEDTIARFAPTLQSNFNASNTAMVAIDPKTGDILTMVGSRDYFDNSIDGNFNIALAKRQPGSTFKPFVYATLFEKGYTPDTILFDTPTEFSSECNPDSTPKNPNASSTKVCYSPKEYDNKYPGPMTIREALPHSRNIPAVQALYLAGLNDSIKTATEMGITSLDEPDRYGLTLVLGGGEVSLLELTSAYGVFANDGVRNQYRSILEVDDGKGSVLEKASSNPNQVIPTETARQINEILANRENRMVSLTGVTDTIGRTVAIKTGTTNDYRDVWTLGYTPNLVVGAWAGNNDNRPMNDAISALIITPVWGAFMSQVAKDFPPEDFKAPQPEPTDIKPVLRGVWQGGISYFIDTVSGKVATQYTPNETKKEIVFPNVHSILQWVNKSDPLGPVPAHPEIDSQYVNWEYAARKWFDQWKLSNPAFKETTTYIIPTDTDPIHTPDKAPRVTITSPTQNSVIDATKLLTLNLQASGAYPLQKAEVSLNGKYVLTNTTNPLVISFVPADVGGLSANNTITVTLYDTVFNQAQVSFDFTTTQ